jgi:predicted metalloendopeptidase
MKRPALKFHETIYGRQTYEQQWKRCVSQLKGELFGLAITAMTARKENEKSRDDVQQMIDNIKHQVMETVKMIPIDSSMRENLIAKIAAIETFVGYAEEFFKDKPLEDFYSDLEIYEGEFFKTAINLEIFSMKTYGRRILKPISETRWETFTGNSFQKSFYSSIQKTIFIHSNDLKSPIYNADLPSYVNYARLGWQVASLYAIAVSFEVC